MERLFAGPDKPGPCDPLLSRTDSVLGALLALFSVLRPAAAWSPRWIYGERESLRVFVECAGAHAGSWAALLVLVTLAHRGAS